MTLDVTKYSLSEAERLIVEHQPQILVMRLEQYEAWCPATLRRCPDCGQARVLDAQQVCQACYRYGLARTVWAT